MQCYQPNVLTSPCLLTDETMLYVHRQVQLPAETHTTSATFTITCSAGNNEPAAVTWFDDGTPIGLNDNNFKPQSGIE